MLKMIMMGFLNCDEASRSLSDGQDSPLPVGRRFRLWVHLLSCKICKGYDQYLEKLRAFSRKLGGIEDLSGIDETLSSEARKKIQKNLQ